jgi:hypothetical protein
VNTQIFTDVAADRWSAGYIAYCANVGILAGTGDGSFNPEGELTGVAFAKMLLVCLGYDAKIEGYQDDAAWATNIAVDAIDAGIDADLNLSSPLSREDAAQMAFLTLQAPLVEYSSKGNEVSVNGAQITFGASQASYVTTTLAKTQTISKQRLTNTNEYTIEFAEKYFPNLVLKDSVTDAFQRPAHTWSYNGSEFGVYYLDDTTLEYTSTVTYGKLYTDLGTAVDAKNIEIYVDGKADTAAAVTRGSTTKVGSSANGVLTEVYETIDNDGTVSLRIVQVNTYVGTVASVTRATSTADRSVTIAATTKKPADLNTKFETEEFAAKDLVSYTAAYNSTTDKYDIQSAAVLEISDTGLLTEWNGTGVVSATSGKSESNFTVNGTTYKYSAKYIVDSDNGEVYDFSVNKATLNVYLDNYGYALYVTGVEAAKQYATVIGVGGSNAYGSSTTGVTLLLADGTQVEATANLATGSTLSTKAVISGSGEQLVTDIVGDLVTYTVNDKGVYTLTVVDGFDVDSTKIGDNAGTAKSSFTNGKSALTLGSSTYYTTSETLFFVCTGTAPKLTYKVYTGYANMPSFDGATGITGFALGLNSAYTNQVDAIYISATKLAGLTGVDTYFVKQANATIITNSTGSYYVLPAIVAGVETTVKVSVSLIPDNSEYGLYAVDNVIQDSNGIITSYSDVTNTTTFNASASTVNHTTSGTVGTVAAGKVVLGIGASGDKTAATYWAYTDSTAVYVVDKAYKTITISAVSAVTNDTNDLVYANYDTTTRVLKDVIIVTQDVTTPTTVTISTDDFAVDYSTSPSSVKVLAYTGASDKGELAGLTAIQNALVAGGYTVNSVDSDDTTATTYHIVATKGGTTTKFTWVSGTAANYVKTGIKIKVDNTDYLVYDSASSGYLKDMSTVDGKKPVAGNYAFESGKAINTTNALDLTTATATDGKAYVSGYFKVSMNATSVNGTVPTGVNTTSTAALKDKDASGNVYVKADGDVTVTIHVVANGAVAANTLKYIVTNTTGSADITVAPTTGHATAMTHAVLANTDTADIDVTVTLSGIASATKDAELQITLSDS